MRRKIGILSTVAENWPEKQLFLHSTREFEFGETQIGKIIAFSIAKYKNNYTCEICGLSTRWYGLITHILRRHASESCQNRLLYVMEGGYNPISLESSVLTTIDAMLEEEVSRPGIFPVPRAEKLLNGHPLHHYWTI